MSDDQRTLTLALLDGRLACCRLSPTAPLPAWATRPGSFMSVTRTPSELSVICDEDAVPEDVLSQRGLRAFVVQGPIGFDDTGVLAALAAPLAADGIAILAISTYDSDYLLVRDRLVKAAVDTLRRAGHEVRVTWYAVP